MGPLTKKYDIGGWCDICSQYNFVPSLRDACKVSPIIGFNGLRNISMYDIDESKATIDNLNLSNESVQVAALLTKWGNRAHG